MGNVNEVARVLRKNLGLPAGESPVATFARGLVDPNGNIVAYANADGTLNTLDGVMLPATTDAGMTVIADDFDRANTALGAVGRGWVDAGSKWQISSNAVRSSVAGYNANFLWRPERFVEPRVTAVVEYKSDGALRQSAAVWLRTDSSAVNGYAGWLTETGGNPVLAVGKFTAGVPTFSTLVIGSLTAGSFYALTVEAIGSRISVSVATAAAPTVILGSLVLVDTAYTSGQVGLSPLVINGQVQDVTIQDRSTAPLVVCDGNSLTVGYGITAASAYPAQLQALLGTGWNVVNLGVSAQTTAAMISDAVSQVDGLYRAHHRKNVVVAWEITNHLYFGADTDTALGVFKAYCSGRRAAGFRVIAMTVTPRSEEGTPVDFNAKRTVVNAELRNTANLGMYWDAVYDVAADPRFSDQTNTTYFTDLVHMTAAGYGIVAEGLAEAIAGVVNG